MKGYPSVGVLKKTKKRKTSLTCSIFTVNFNCEVIKFCYFFDYCSKVFFRGPVGDLSSDTVCYAALSVSLASIQSSRHRLDLLDIWGNFLHRPN